MLSILNYYSIFLSIKTEGPEQLFLVVKYAHECSHLKLSSLALKTEATELFWKVLGFLFLNIKLFRDKKNCWLIFDFQASGVAQG